MFIKRPVTLFADTHKMRCSLPCTAVVPTVYYGMSTLKSVSSKLTLDKTCCLLHFNKTGNVTNVPCLFSSTRISLISFSPFYQVLYLIFLSNPCNQCVLHLLLFCFYFCLDTINKYYMTDILKVKYHKYDKLFIKICLPGCNIL